MVMNKQECKDLMSCFFRSKLPDREALPILMYDTGFSAIRSRRSDGLPVLSDSGGKARNRKSLRQGGLYFADN